MAETQMFTAGLNSGQQTINDIVGMLSTEGQPVEDTGELLPGGIPNQTLVVPQQQSIVEPLGNQSRPNTVGWNGGSKKNGM